MWILSNASISSSFDSRSLSFTFRSRTKFFESWNRKRRNKEPSHIIFLFFHHHQTDDWILNVFSIFHTFEFLWSSEIAVFIFFELLIPFLLFFFFFGQYFVFSRFRFFCTHIGFCISDFGLCFSAVDFFVFWTFEFEFLLAVFVQFERPKQVSFWYLVFFFFTFLLTDWTCFFLGRCFVSNSLLVFRDLF